jgi:hypothetical protein
METTPDAVARLFTPRVLRNLAAIKRQPSHPADDAGWPMRVRHTIFSGQELPGEAMRARRAAWCSYVVHADAAGLLDRDLAERLTSESDDDFRGALAECLAVWFFAQRLDVTLRRHVGSGGDFEAEGPLRFEVKSPYVPVFGNTISGDDAEALGASIKKAGKQLEPGLANIVVIVPMLRTPVWMDRHQLVKATLGEWTMAVSVGMSPGAAAVEPEPVFLQEGKLAKLFPAGDGTMKALHRRVAAVVVIEEELRVVAAKPVVDHLVHAVHNPFATREAPERLFKGYPQLVVRGEGMLWTDRPGSPDDDNGVAGN